MNRAGQVLALLAIAAVAAGVSGSLWGGIVIAALELAFCGLLRSSRQPG